MNGAQTFLSDALENERTICPANNHLDGALARRLRWANSSDLKRPTEADPPDYSFLPPEIMKYFLCRACCVSGTRSPGQKAIPTRQGEW